jgi:hypothetical protein
MEERKSRPQRQVQDAAPDCLKRTRKGEVSAGAKALRPRREARPGDSPITTLPNGPIQ